MSDAELKPVMVAPAGLIEAGKTYLLQSIESDDGNFYDRENVDNYVNQLREENEQLISKAQLLVDVIENPHPTKYAIQVGMSSGLLGLYLNQLKAAKEGSK